ncbi:MAG TPA: hypothetical protein VM509_13960, partial [Planctomycetota bacterium]|nr:hypothetical protein [Planctomycetota bacterium]
RLDSTSVGTSYCALSPNSAGPGARVSASGSTSVAQQDLVLQANGCPPNKPGLFVYGSQAAQVPLGNGLLCVGGAVGRRPALVLSPTGTAAQLLNYTQTAITAGSTWHFQLWFRDPAGLGARFNLSNGLRVTFQP